MSEVSAIFYFGVILLIAKISAEIAHRLKLPQVMGYLIAGVLLGNYVEFFTPSRLDIQILNYISRIGLIFLMFKIGLESNLRAMAAYGRKAFGISIAGIITSFIFALLWTFTGFFIYIETIQSKLIISTIFIATSIGISAKVLEEMNKLELLESNMVVEASFMDDILSLIVFAIILGSIHTHMSITNLILIVLKIVVFLSIFLIVGRKMMPYIIKITSYSKTEDTLLIVLVSIGFFSAYISEGIGLAYIAGTLLLGIILSDSQMRPIIEDRLDSICNLVVPVFFVMVGLDLKITNLNSIILSGSIATLVAIAGKTIGCGLAAYYEGFTYLQALRIGIAMIPRAEVPIVIATIALRDGYIDGLMLSNIIFMVIATSLITVILLKIVFSGDEKILSAEIRHISETARKIENTCFSIKKFHIGSVADIEHIVSQINHKTDIVLLKAEEGMIRLLRNIIRDLSLDMNLSQIDKNFYVMKPALLDEEPQ